MKPKDIAFLVGFIVLAVHACVIADDVLNIVNDPDERNKPGEVLKLAVDVSRYWPK